MTAPANYPATHGRRDAVRPPQPSGLGHVSRHAHDGQDTVACIAGACPHPPTLLGLEAIAGRFGVRLRAAESRTGTFCKVYFGSRTCFSRRAKVWMGSQGKLWDRFLPNNGGAVLPFHRNSPNPFAAAAPKAIPFQAVPLMIPRWGSTRMWSCPSEAWQLTMSSCT